MARGRSLSDDLQMVPPLTRRRLDAGARVRSVRVERVVVTAQGKWGTCSR
jgi:hypothetical protein